MLNRKTNPSRSQAATTAQALPIGEITIGQRFRREVGDVTSPAANIAEIGLLHPVVIRPDGTLIAGERRVRAAELLGWTEIAARVIDLDAVVRGEHAENTFRKDFTLTEAVAIKRALEPMERAAAKERQTPPFSSEWSKQ